MKIFRVVSFCFFISTLALSAQISVEVVPTQGQFLPGEPLRVEVRITNRSGQSLKLGEDNEWLKISVESKDGYVVSQLGEVPVKKEFTLDSSKMVRRWVDIAPCFSLTKPGHYLVSATVKVKEWDKEFSAAVGEFDIVKGMNLREMEFGVPTVAGQSPEVRKYALQQANYLKQLWLYVRVTDSPETRVIRVVPIGTMVSFSEPEAQVDSASNLHVLWQTGARGFAYRVVNPAGEIIVRETHDFQGTRPKLRADETGKILVSGGLRHPMRDDLPVAEAAPVALPKP